jgi:hypothetical protein
VKNRSAVLGTWVVLALSFLAHIKDSLELTCLDERNHHSGQVLTKDVRWEMDPQALKEQFCKCTLEVLQQTCWMIWPMSDNVRWRIVM